MELRQLRYLVAVAEEQSFTRAAERLHVAQPGVSAQVRRLERELGSALLDRTRRGVRPTEAGAAVLPHARAALAAAEAAGQAVEDLAGLVRGAVTVGVVASIGSGVVDLAGLLAGFHEQYPGVEIALREGSTGDLARAVLAGEVDLALAGVGTSPPPGLGTQVVVDVPLVVAVARGDPLARRGRVALASLRDRPLITLPPGTGVRSVLDEACAAAGFTPRIAFEAGDPPVLAQLAARGLGTAVLPEPAVAGAAVHAAPVTRPALRGRIALVWRDGGPAGAAARALVDHARAVLA